MSGFKRESAHCSVLHTKTALKHLNYKQNKHKKATKLERNKPKQKQKVKTREYIDRKSGQNSKTQNPNWRDDGIE